MAEIRTVTPSDYPDVARFLEGFQGGRHPAARWLERFGHWWDRNPALEGDSARGWLLCEGATIVGFLGAIPLRVVTPAGTGLSVSTTTFWVLPEHRRHSLQLFVRSLDRGYTAHLNTTANELASPVFERLRFRRFPGEYRTERRVLVLDGARLLRRTLRGRASPWTVKVVASLLGPAARLAADALRRWAGGRRAVSWAELDPADPRIDRLWARSELRHRFTAVRTREVVRWFVSDADRSKTVLGSFEAGELTGFAVLARQREPDLDLAECADLFAREDSRSVIEGLVAAAGEWAASRRLTAVILQPFSQAMADTLRALRLFPRRVPDPREYIRLTDGSGVDLSEAGCYLTHLHGDRFLA